MPGTQPRQRRAACTGLAWLLLAAPWSAGAVQAASPAAVAAPPTAAAIETRIRSIHAWLVAPKPAQGGSRLLMGETRSELQQQSGEPRQADAQAPARFQTTAACATLEFLAAYAGHYGLDPATAAAMNHMASSLRQVRAAPGTGLRAGAFAAETEARNYVTFGNAMCGRAFLEAHRATGNREWLEFAAGIGDYFVRLWQAGEQMADAGRDGQPAQAVGLFDRVTSAGKIQVTSSTWNLTAAAFLHRLNAVAPRPAYASVSQSIARFHIEGVRGGYDYFAPRFDAANARLIGRWNLGYASAGGPRHDFADGKWHRHGDIRQPPTGTVGTDQIEYGLQALADMGWARDETARLYATYRGLAPQTACLDPGVSFSGFFRLEPGGGMARGAGYGRYYDIVGAGILAGLKRQLALADHQRAIAALVANEGDWTMLDCELRPIWTRSAKGGADAEESRRSTLVAAASGVALLEALKPPKAAAR